MKLVSGLLRKFADTKFTHNARSLFKHGKELMGKKPSLLITDGLPVYRDAFDKEYFSLKNPRPKHQYTFRISGGMNKHKMERFNCDGEKAGIKKEGHSYSDGSSDIRYFTTTLNSRRIKQ